MITVIKEIVNQVGLGNTLICIGLFALVVYSFSRSSHKKSDNSSAGSSKKSSSTTTTSSTSDDTK